MIIRAIVYAKDEGGALEEAERVFETLVENSTFDYYCMFRKTDAGHMVSGSDRWGEITPVAKVTSKEGKKLIDEGMEYTKQEFVRGLNYIRDAVKDFTDEELFNDKKVQVHGMKGMFRYFCHCVGQYVGSDIYLYDNDGSGIRSDNDLKNALEQYGHPKKDIKVYIVPADVHY